MEFGNSDGIRELRWSSLRFWQKAALCFRLKTFVNFDQLLQMSLGGLFFWKSLKPGFCKKTGLFRTLRGPLRRGGAPCPPGAFCTGDHRGIAPTSTSPREILETQKLVSGLRSERLHVASRLRGVFLQSVGGCGELESETRCDDQKKSKSQRQ